jgi:hypothetical protein
LQVGSLFLCETEAIERIVGTKSGVTSPLADEMEIDAKQLETFIQATLRMLAKTNNGPLVALIEGCLAIAIALNAEITGSWPDVPERLRFVVDRARTVMLPMDLEQRKEEINPRGVARQVAE